MNEYKNKPCDYSFYFTFNSTPYSFLFKLVYLNINSSTVLVKVWKRKTIPVERLKREKRLFFAFPQTTLAWSNLLLNEEGLIS